MGNYSINDIERLTGIKSHTIRIWEKRYEVFQPERTDTNIRYYTDDTLRKILKINILYNNGLKISKIAKKRKILTVCDNTFATPHNQKPLECGIDIVNHSTTKYINGHSDIIGGALIIGNNKSLQKKISFIQNSVGAVPSPFDCFLTLRGIKTLGIRMKRHNENGLKIARFLKSHKKIKSVIYPGLPSHEQHKIAAKQMNGYGGMISFIHKGSLAEIKSFMKKLKIFTTAESLGGVESLIESPALMTHAYVNSSKVNIPVPENLVRISVGIENVDDLIEDLQIALN